MPLNAHILKPLISALTLASTSECNYKTVTDQITCCRNMVFTIDDSNRVTVAPVPVNPANLTEAETEALERYNATVEFMDNKSSAVRRDDGSYYTWTHDNRVNVHNEVVYKREDSAYYLFYNIDGSKADTFGWFIHNDDSKTDLTRDQFQASAGNTYFYLHDDSESFSNTLQLCPWQTSFPWRSEYNGRYYILTEELNIQMSLACVDTGDTVTISMESFASSVTVCNVYGVDPALITQIESSYDQIFDNFDPKVSPLSDTPFWICIAFHVGSVVFLLIMGIYPIVKLPASHLEKRRKDRRARAETAT